jgi:AbiV family abortive infection protein
LPRPILSPQKLSQLSIAALHNCQDLLSTAKMLLGTDKFGRAHALATLAMEEFGKHVIAAAAITRSAYSGYDWVKFWKRINGHESKLRQAAIALDALRPDDKWLEDLTLVMASAKPNTESNCMAYTLTSTPAANSALHG